MKADATRLRISAIKQIVAAHFGRTVAQLDSYVRTETLATHRQIAMVLAREHTKASFEELAAAFKRDDHETIRHAARAVARKLAAQPDLQTQYANVDRKIRFVLANETPTTRGKSSMEAPQKRA